MDMTSSEPAAKLLDAAIERYQKSAYNEAAAILAELLHVAPDDATCLRLRGLSLTRAGRTKEALPLLARARTLAPAEGLSHLHYGVGLQHAGRYARAAAMFRRAAILLPDNPAPWVNMSVAVLALGHAGAARAAARRALRIAPNLADAHHALGLAESAAGSIAAARDAFVRATKLNPALAESWVGLGRALHQLGDTDQAMSALQHALRAHPGHTAAEANLAGFSILSGDTDEAIQKLRAVLERDPDCIAARLNLANALLLERQPKDALALLQGSPPPGQNGVHYRAHRVMALLQLGRALAAQAELDAIAPPYGDAEILILWRRIGLLMRSGKLSETAPLAQSMEELAAKDQAALYEHRVIAYFDLAGLHNDIGDRNAAFRCWRNGHRLLQRTQPYSRASELRFIETSIEAYSAARLRDGDRAQNRDPSPVFIVGMPRSGTSLAEQVLAAHALIHGAGERPDLMRTLRSLAGPPNDPASIRRAAALKSSRLDAAAARYLEDLHALAPDARFIIDKMPGNARHLGFAATLLPGARVIHCTRDPRDVGLSIFKLRFFGYHPYAHDLGDLGWAIGQHYRLMEHWRAALPVPVLDVALTDWVEDFRGTLTRVLNFLGLSYDPACERFYEQPRRVRTASAQQVREPVNRRGVGRFRFFEDLLGPMIEELERAGLIPPASQ